MVLNSRIMYLLFLTTALNLLHAMDNEQPLQPYNVERANQFILRNLANISLADTYEMLHKNFPLNCMKAALSQHTESYDALKCKIEPNLTSSPDAKELEFASDDEIQSLNAARKKIELTDTGALFIVCALPDTVKKYLLTHFLDLPTESYETFSKSPTIQVFELYAEEDKYFKESVPFNTRHKCSQDQINLLKKIANDHYTPTKSEWALLETLPAEIMLCNVQNEHLQWILNRVSEPSLLKNYCIIHDPETAQTGRKIVHTLFHWPASDEIIPDMRSVQDMLLSGACALDIGYHMQLNRDSVTFMFPSRHRMFLLGSYALMRLWYTIYDCVKYIPRHTTENIKRAYGDNQLYPLLYAPATFKLFFDQENKQRSGHCTSLIGIAATCALQYCGSQTLLEAGVRLAGAAAFFASSIYFPFKYKQISAIQNKTTIEKIWQKAQEKKIKDQRSCILL